MNQKLNQWLDRAGPILGNVIVGAFGDKFILGALIGTMDEITPMQCYECIRYNKHLFPDDQIGADDWAKIREFVRNAKLDRLDNDKIEAAFRKHRPDLLSVVINHPIGRIWFFHEMQRIRSKLGLS